ncbi:MAG: metal-dependent transcriptional regulator [Nitriliruptoraceae bacterium]|nr:metal-dependent transcriptional regulator [Nitriliruptoraceae bacterium]
MPTAVPTRDALITEVLEVLLEQDQIGLPPTTADLERRIPVPCEDVTGAVEALRADGTVEVRGDGLGLTPTGRERAVTAVRRHRLTERLLADVLGLEWWKVHHEAARLEGMLSEDLEARVLDLLDDPGTCPHGNPIPGSANQPSHPDAVTLAEAPLGPVHIVRITETLEGDDEALQLLQNCGFVPGRDAEVKEQRDGWALVAGTVRDAALPPHVAAHTYVAPR